jgi:hypothetical protein
MSTLNLTLPIARMTSATQSDLVLAMINHIMYIRELIPEPIDNLLKHEQNTRTITKLLTQYEELRRDIISILSMPNKHTRAVKILIGCTLFSPKEGNL